MVLLAGCSQVGNLAVAQDTTAQVLWNRGGSAPELSQVTFELSVNGCATWTSLGAGTRVGPTAYWQRTGLALPTSGQIRARGRPSGGQQPRQCRMGADRGELQRDRTGGIGGVTRHPHDPRHRGRWNPAGGV